MVRRKEVVFPALTIYIFVIIVFIILRSLYFDYISEYYFIFILSSPLIVFLISYFYLFKRKSRNLFLIESKSIKERDINDSKIIKLQKEKNKLSKKVKTLESERDNLRIKVEELEKRSKGKYKIEFLYNSEEKDTLTDKIQNMLKKAKGKQIRYIGLIDGMFKEDFLRALSEGNLKIILRKIGSGKDIISFCKILNAKGAPKKWVIRQNENNHGRILIIGNEELIVMTTDILKDVITRSDFGVWTNDAKIVREAIQCFENINSSKNTKDFFPR